MGPFRRDWKLVNNLFSFIKPYYSGWRGSLSPLDSLVSRVHYKASVGIFLCLFTAITSFWFVTDPMKCVLKFDRRQVTGALEELCLSYPFTYNASVLEFPRKRVYALHYRWVHYALLILVFLYHLPLLCRKHLDRKDLNYLLSQADHLNLQEERRQKALRVVSTYVGRCGFFYWRILLLHFLNVIIDIFSFFFLDIVLQNRFARLFPIDYPFTRWPQHFNDTLSVAFPPFAECKIGPEMMLLINREETLGCSLPLMTIYQKCFIFLWLWIVLLLIWSLYTFFYYCALGVSRCCQGRLIHITGRRSNVKTCLKFLSVGDMILLNKIRFVATGEEYRQIITDVSQTISEERERGVYSQYPIGWNLNLKRNDLLPVVSLTSSTSD